ncbi:MAG: hypothetical protein LBQ14_12305 [Treponema sp.]|jgi:hypothetical protein|nr:hypothetical protein [Treponema sp.]
MGSHPFNFEGGTELSTMGATWFVSYAFYTHIDKSHTCWQNVATFPDRIEVFNLTDNYHKFWLGKIAGMNDKKLNTNKIGLKAVQVKKMAKNLLERFSHLEANKTAPESAGTRHGE